MTRFMYYNTPGHFASNFDLKWLKTFSLGKNSFISTYKKKVLEFFSLINQSSNYITYISA